MKRSILTTFVGFGWLLSLMGCVVAPPPPPRPIAVIPAPVMVAPPVVVAPAPVVVGPGYWHWYHGRRVWVRRRYWHHRHY
jgi:hypothetical protein